MGPSNTDELIRAQRLLTNFEGITNPEKRIQEFEHGMDLLSQYVRDNQPLERGTERWIQELRSSCVQKLLRSLTEVRGGSIKPWLDHVSILLVKMKPELDAVLKDYSRNSGLFSQPLDREVVQISPPALTWEPLKNAFCYRVEIQNESGQSIYERTVGNDPVHVPDQILPFGQYTWDIRAIDVQGLEQARRGKRSFTIPENVPTLPWIEPTTLLARVPKEHPRFIYTKRDLAKIRKTLDSSRQRSWKACVDAAERALEVPTPLFPSYHLNKNLKQAQLEYKQYLFQFYQFIDNALMDLSLAFLVTEQPQYAEAAKRILLEVTKWPTHDNDVTSVSSRWGDGPGLSLARCGHRAYDWLYDALTPDERNQVLTMCKTRAGQAYRRLVRCNYLSYPGESHNGRLIAYLTEMAIVMAHEAEEVSTWLDYSLKALCTFFPHWGGMEGGWAEGTAYGQTYNLNYIPAIETLKNTTEFDLWKRPFFQKIRYFLFYCTAVRGEIAPFGDHADTGGVINRKEGYASLLRHHAHRFNDPYIGWWVNHIEGRADYKGELALLFEDSIPAKPPRDLAQSRVFRDVGWAALHSDLSSPDTDTFLLFKSSPFGSVSHSHADQNSFCIMKGGRALAIPSGHYGPMAGMPHHVQWTCSTKANNCILVNGEGQPTQERSAKGKIKAFEYRKEFTYVAGDATPAYMGKLTRFTRHILFLPPGLFLLLDDLEAPDPSVFQWMLHAFEKLDVESSLGRVISRRSGASLVAHLRSPVGLKFSQTDQFDVPYNQGVPPKFYKEVPNQWHLTAETKEKTKAIRIGAIMGTWGPSEKFELEVFQRSDGWFGAQATGDFGQVEGWMQLQPDTAGPEDYGKDVADGKAIFFGQVSNGKRFVQLR